MCCSEKLKIVPIYDDRSCGTRTENQTESKKRMRTICAPKDDDEYVWSYASWTRRDKSKYFLVVTLSVLLLILLGARILLTGSNNMLHSALIYHNP